MINVDKHKETLGHARILQLSCLVNNCIIHRCLMLVTSTLCEMSDRWALGAHFARQRVTDEHWEHTLRDKEWQMSTGNTLCKTESDSQHWEHTLWDKEWQTNCGSTLCETKSDRRALGAHFARQRVTDEHWEHTFARQSDRRALEHTLRDKKWQMSTGAHFGRQKVTDEQWEHTLWDKLTDEQWEHTLWDKLTDEQWEHALQDKEWQTSTGAHFARQKVTDKQWQHTLWDKQWQTSSGSTLQDKQLQTSSGSTLCKTNSDGQALGAHFARWRVTDILNKMMLTTTTWTVWLLGSEAAAVYP